MMSPEFAPTGSPLMHAVLFDALHRISAELAESSADSEQNATLSPRAVAALECAGIFRLKLPKLLGGAEADPLTQMELIEALATVDTASAWCTMIGATSIALLGAFLPEPGLQQVFGGNQVPLAALSAFPAGVAIPETGGYRLNGRWRYCSGIRHARYVSVAAVVQPPDCQQAAQSHQPEVIFLALPATDVTIHDNWRVIGLSGTGSNDISVTDCFVPQTMTYSWDPLNPLPQRGGSLFRLPVVAFVTCEHIAFALGVARRALDELIAHVQRAVGAAGNSPLQDRQVVQRLVGRFELELAAARSLAFDRYRAAWERAEAGAQIDARLRSELRALGTYTTELAVNIAASAFRYGGAGVLYQPNTLEQLLRDIQAAAQHAAVSDAAYEAYGRNVLGLVQAKS